VVRVSAGVSLPRASDTIPEPTEAPISRRLWSATIAGWARDATLWKAINKGRNPGLISDYALRGRLRVQGIASFGHYRCRVSSDRTPFSRRRAGLFFFFFSLVDLLPTPFPCVCPVALVRMVLPWFTQPQIDCLNAALFHRALYPRGTKPRPSPRATTAD